jgi:hypothetical protein
MDDLPRLDGIGIRAFVLTMTNPALVRQLVVEEMTVERQGIRRDVTVHMLIPRRIRRDAEESSGVLTYCLPAMWRDAGSPLQIVEITGSEGRQLRVLRNEEYLQLVRVALTTLLRAAYQLSSQDQPLPPQAVSLLDDALDLLAKRAKKSADNSDITGGILDLDVDHKEYLKLAAEMIRKLSSAIPVVVEIPFDSNRATMRYQEHVPLTHSARGRVFAAVGVLLGAGPTRLQVALSDYRTTQEYRLRVRVPDGYYFSGQHLVGVDSADQDNLQWTMQRRNGLPYAFFSLSWDPHVSLPAEYPRLRLSFAEVPPGKSLSAAIAAGSCAALIWFIGLALSHTTKSGIGTDAPALLLAFPAVAAGWLSFDRPSKRLSEGPLSAQVSLLSTLALSLVAAGMFMLSESSFAIFRKDAFDGLGLLGISLPTWIVMLLLAIINASFISWVCLRETLGYLRVLVRPAEASLSVGGNPPGEAGSLADGLALAARRAPGLNSGAPPDER